MAGEYGKSRGGGAWVEGHGLEGQWLEAVTGGECLAGLEAVTGSDYEQERALAGDGSRTLMARAAPAKPAW